MDQNDIAKAQEASDIMGQQLYTFENVEVNYEENTDQSYTSHQAEDMQNCVKLFDGNEDHTLNDKFELCQYDKFLFTGTLYKQSGSNLINTGDYIIQKNNFVKCLDGKTYGLKGFRGFFKKHFFDSETKGNFIHLNVINENGSTTAITHIDGETIAPANLYDLRGLKMGYDASRLPKGVYISNGKKMIIK